MVKRNVNGFTLLELLIVIAILGILATIALMILKPAFLFGQSRNVQRKNDLKQIQAALQNYYADNGSYPVVAGWSGEPSGYGGLPTSYIPGLVPNYIKKLPNDPLAGQSYPPCNNGASTGYLYYSNGTDYKVLSHCAYENPYPISSSSIPNSCNAAYPGSEDPFFDKVRPTWAIQVSSEGGECW